ncbi:uncharacterized protein LOC112494457 [Cephus cinctus]|uniref:Uncharacterized protein LOC112494457 n=1 Tax=Cephus cinctus TaxID=211228 RepID=A0AAJ7RI90_CEPCN|nr:uncharacterized protein LOC112494457 [Cephus cinctus]
MTRTELDNCKKIKDQYLCEARHPVLKFRPYGSCETQLFTNPSSYPLSCETRQIKIEYTLLIEMENPNSWLHVADKPEQMMVSCNNENPKRVVMQGSGIIEIKGKCKLTAEDFTLETEGKYKLDVTLNYVPPLNLTLITDNYVPNTVSNNNNIQPKLRNLIKDPSELNALSKKISEIENDLKGDNIDTFVDIISSPISYSIGTIFCITILILIIVIYFLRKRANLTTSGETTPPSVIVIGNSSPNPNQVTP